MFRITASGCVGVSMASAKVTVQFTPPGWSSPVSEGNWGRLRRMRIACPFSSGMTLTSAMTDPTWPRMGSTSIGLVESNSSHTVSARRNNAAGVAAGNENVRRRPSLSRLAFTLAGLPSDLISAGGAGATRGAFGGASATAAGGSFAAGAASGFSGGASAAAAGRSFGGGAAGGACGGASAAEAGGPLGAGSGI